MGVTFQQKEAVMAAAKKTAKNTAEVEKRETPKFGSKAGKAAAAEAVEVAKTRKAKAEEPQGTVFKKYPAAVGKAVKKVEKVVEEVVEEVADVAVKAAKKAVGKTPALNGRAKKDDLPVAVAVVKVKIGKKAAPAEAKKARGFDGSQKVVATEAGLATLEATLLQNAIKKAKKPISFDKLVAAVSEGLDQKEVRAKLLRALSGSGLLTLA